MPLVHVGAIEQKPLKLVPCDANGVARVCKKDLEAVIVKHALSQVSSEVVDVKNEQHAPIPCRKDDVCFNEFLRHADAPFAAQKSTVEALNAAVTVNRLPHDEDTP